eukprot:3836692-Alexandrium_andersonii.AAC.1
MTSKGLSLGVSVGGRDSKSMAGVHLRAPHPPRAALPSRRGGGRFQPRRSRPRGRHRRAQRSAQGR